jgi:asparagine synthase (glutamine-hydrolysing)
LFETDHYDLVVRNPPPELLEKVVWHLDEPVADEAALPTFLLSGLARQHVKVVLTGEGADELFAGYGYYYHVKRLHELQSVMPRAFVRAARLALGVAPEDGRGGVWIDRARKILAGLGSSPAESFPEYNQTTTSYFRQGLYSDGFKQFLQSHRSSTDWRKTNYFDKVSAHNALNQVLYVDTKTWLPDRLLMKVDKMTMANSLEARTPYLDHHLVEGVFRMPVNLKLRRDNFKYILRRLGQRILPETIWSRPKHGFLVPYREWFTGPLKPFVYDVLSSQGMRDHGMFAESAVENLLSGYFDQGKQSERNTRSLLALVLFQLWYERFLRPGVLPSDRDCGLEETAHGYSSSRYRDW